MVSATARVVSFFGVSLGSNFFVGCNFFLMTGGAGAGAALMFEVPGSESESESESAPIGGAQRIKGE